MLVAEASVLEWSSARRWSSARSLNRVEEEGLLQHENRASIRSAEFHRGVCFS